MLHVPFGAFLRLLICRAGSKALLESSLHVVCNEMSFGALWSDNLVPEPMMSLSFALLRLEVVRHASWATWGVEETSDSVLGTDLIWPDTPCSCSQASDEAIAWPNLSTVHTRAHRPRRFCSHVSKVFACREAMNRRPKVSQGRRTQRNGSGNSYSEAYRSQSIRTASVLSSDHGGERLLAFGACNDEASFEPSKRRLRYRKSGQERLQSGLGSQVPGGKSC